MGRNQRCSRCDDIRLAPQVACRADTGRLFFGDRKFTQADETVFIDCRIDNADTNTIGTRPGIQHIIGICSIADAGDDDNIFFHGEIFQSTGPPVFKGFSKTERNDIGLERLFIEKIHGHKSPEFIHIN